MWGLHYRIHSRYTYVLQHVYPVHVQLNYRFARSLFNAVHNNNPIIVSCSKLYNYSNTSVARNRRILPEWLNDNGSIFQNFVSMIKLNFYHKTLYNQNYIIESMHAGD